MIALSIFMMISHIVQNPFEIQGSEEFYQFMKDALSLIVGIEFLKMIVIPTADNIIETLLFAVSRQVILDHSVEVTIVGIICIGILFLIKKYLFTDLHDEDEIVLKGTSRITRLNEVAEIETSLGPSDETISEYIIKKLKEDNKVPLIGSTIKLNENTVLKVLKLTKDGQIKTAEIINK